MKRQDFTRLQWVLHCIARRFIDSKQELRVARHAGIVRDLAEAKGGHNRKAWNGRKKGEPRVKKAPYKWGKLSQNISLPEASRGQSPKVIKQYQKSEAYKRKVKSKKWRKAANDR